MSTLAFMYASLLAAAAAPGVARAQGAAVGPAVGAAHVAVQTIHAKGGAEASTAPAALVDRLSKAFPAYRAFHLLGAAEWDLTAGATGRHALPNAKELSVTYLGPQDDLLRLQVAIPPTLKTDVRVKNGGTFYQAGLEHQGGILILSINARRK